MILNRICFLLKRNISYTFKSISLHFLNRISSVLRSPCLVVGQFLSLNEDFLYSYLVVI